MGLGDLQPAREQEPHQDVLLQVTAGKQIRVHALEEKRCQGQVHGDTREEFSPKGPDPEFLEAGGEGISPLISKQTHLSLKPLVSLHLTQTCPHPLTALYPSAEAAFPPHAPQPHHPRHRALPQGGAGPSGSSTVCCWARPHRGLWGGGDAQPSIVRRARLGGHLSAVGNASGRLAALCEETGVPPLPCLLRTRDLI